MFAQHTFNNFQLSNEQAYNVLLLKYHFENTLLCFKGMQFKKLLLIPKEQI